MQVRECVCWGVGGVGNKLGRSHSKSTDSLRIRRTLCVEHLKTLPGASVVVQWEIIFLPMQETRVQSPVREDPTCCEATKPVCCMLHLCSRDGEPQLLKPRFCNERPQHRHQERPSLTTTREKPSPQRRPSLAKNKEIKKIIKKKKKPKTCNVSAALKTCTHERKSSMSSTVTVHCHRAAGAKLCP